MQFWEEPDEEKQGQKNDISETQSQKMQFKNSVLTEPKNREARDPQGSGQHPNHQKSPGLPAGPVNVCAGCDLNDSSTIQVLKQTIEAVVKQAKSRERKQTSKITAANHCVCVCVLCEHGAFHLPPKSDFSAGNNATV